ncbi:MAG: hypothetical protein ACLRTD_26350 [Bacteroides sp.]
MKATLKIAFWLVLAMFVKQYVRRQHLGMVDRSMALQGDYEGIIRFLFGCIVFLLSAVALLRFLFWLLTL